jgi:hypothetical protein
MPESAFIRWELEGDYAEIGGPMLIRQAVGEALGRIPREHLRRLDAIIVQDRDPKGKALGVWRQNAHGLSIELYAVPHVTDVLRIPAEVRPFALRLYLAHTLFHEVGHHVTLHLNRRAAPTRKKAQVEQTLEKWAEQYVAKRMQGLVNAWQKPGGPADTPEGRKALLAALRYLQLQGRIQLVEGEPGE